MKPIAVRSRYTGPRGMGERKVGAARLKLSLPKVAKGDMKNLRELSELEVPSAEQGKGYATSLVHAVCREADAEGLVLMLAPQPFGDNIAMSKDQLSAWYIREFGFMVVQAEPLLMARLPGSTPGAKLRLKPLNASLYQRSSL